MRTGIECRQRLEPGDHVGGKRAVGRAQVVEQLYFASLQPGTGTLAGLRMAPVRARKLRLRRAPEPDAQWLRAALERASRRFGSRVDLQPDGLLALRPGAS